MADRGRPLKFKTAEELQEAIDKYFLQEDEWAKKHAKSLPIYTMAGLGNAIGLSRQGILEYSTKEDFSDTIKSAKEKVELMVEKRLLNGESPSGHIFNLKNNFNWKDTTQQQQVDGEGNTVEPTIKIEFVGKDE